MPGFASHTLGRQLALQFLFGLDFHETPWRHALSEFWRMDPVGLTRSAMDKGESAVVSQRLSRRTDPDAAKEYAEGLIAGVCACREELDTAITGILDNWKPERVGHIEWAILRLAYYEMRYCPETPHVVVIAEAVRLANAFGDKDSSRFVNGLLDKLQQALSASADIIYDE